MINSKGLYVHIYPLYHLAKTPKSQPSYVHFPYWVPGVISILSVSMCCLERCPHSRANLAWRPLLCRAQWALGCPCLWDKMIDLQSYSHSGCVSAGMSSTSPQLSNKMFGLQLFCFFLFSQSPAQARCSQHGCLSRKGRGGEGPHHHHITSAVKHHIHSIWHCQHGCHVRMLA